MGMDLLPFSVMEVFSLYSVFLPGIFDQLLNDYLFKYFACYASYLIGCLPASFTLVYNVMSCTKIFRGMILV